MCVWVEDADELDINSSELEVLYENRVISDYLSPRSRRLGIAGVKGQGKTFLIKVKRKRIMEDDPGIICLPRDQMVDIIDSSFPIDDSLYNYLNDYHNWVDLWKYAICITLINHSEIYTYLGDIELSSETRRQLKLPNPKYMPSVILCNILTLNIREYISAIRDTGKLMDVITRIHNSVCVFFDKIDQGMTKYITSEIETSRMPMRSRKVDFWIYGQYALADAAYDIKSRNNHIKVYYTIRQEALLSGKIKNGNKARNILASISLLKYTKSNLRELYRKYVASEEDKNLIEPQYKLTYPSRAFLGLENISHGYVDNQEENIFDYIYRHTFHRPYDIMKICRELYLYEDKDTEHIRHVVNKHSDEILHLYMNELELFLPYSIEELEALIRAIPGNILDRELIQTACNAFFHNTTKKDNTFCSEYCESCEYSHPFSVLYTLGLIGKIKKNPADKIAKQEFMNIGDGAGIKMTPLPRSEYYFLHPSISNYVRDKRKDRGLPFSMSNTIIIGDECNFDIEKSTDLEEIVTQSKERFKEQRVFLSSTVHDMGAVRDRIRDHLISRWLFPVMSDRADFDLKNANNEHSHDICLDEVLTCRNMIFIFGSNFGGTYAGDKYKNIAEEIENGSQGKISEPSISLMELYFAKKNGVQTYVYRSKEVEEMLQDKTLDEKVRTEINFINHFSTPEKPEVHGNWMETYQNEEELLNRIESIKFFN